MENAPTFDLNNAIGRWRDGLSQSPQFREENVAELEAHLRDSVADLQSRGLTGEEAFLLGARRLGSPAWLEPEFAKINRGQVWLQRLLWMLVGIQVWGLFSTLSRGAVQAALIGGMAGFGYNFPRTDAFSARNLIIAALLVLANLLGLAGCVAGGWWLVRRKEETAHKVTLKALRRPVLLGLAVSLFLWVISFTQVWVLNGPLVFKRYGPAVLSNLYAIQSLAWAVLGPLQTLAFVILTIVLLRRRLCSRSAA